RPKVAVAGFLAGGQSALEAIERACYDVLPGPPRAGHARRVLALAAALRAGRSQACGAGAVGS
ncbi:MAG: squalene synthase HpnC, partial [Solirubrobacteraceae bacterium]